MEPLDSSRVQPHYFFYDSKTCAFLLLRPLDLTYFIYLLYCVPPAAFSFFVKQASSKADNIDGKSERFFKKSLAESA